MSPGASREDQIFEEWLEFYRDRKLGPVDPEVAAILREWEQGGDGLPWRDAAGGKIGSDEGGPPGFPAAGNVPAA